MMQQFRELVVRGSFLLLVGGMVWGCGSTAAKPVSSPTSPASAEPMLSHELSCQRIDALFEFDSRGGTGAVSPMYGFMTPDGASPTEEEAVKHLKDVQSSYQKVSPRLDPAVQVKTAAIVEQLDKQRVVREKRIAEQEKKSEESRKRVEAAGNDPVKMRQEMLKDAAEYGMMGLLGNESELGPLREAYFDAYLDFFDECATDLGISEKAQAAHRALFPRKSERTEEK